MLTPHAAGAISMSTSLNEEGRLQNAFEGNDYKNNFWAARFFLKPSQARRQRGAGGAIKSQWDQILTIFTTKYILHIYYEVEVEV